MAPADVPEGTKLFIQSTSHSRKVPANTSVMLVAANEQITATCPALQASQKVKAQGLPSGAVCPPTKRAKALPKSSPAINAAAKVAAGPILNQGAPAEASCGAWDKVGDSLHVRDYGSLPSAKMAGFDMDWTLIRTKTGKTFPQNAEDYKLWHAGVPAKIQELANQGFRIAIFTNQNGVQTGVQNLKEITNKIDKLQQILGVPLVALISTGTDEYRKPSVCAWEYVENVLGDCKSGRKQCLFIGDMAGRAKTKLTKKDHTDTDLKFALNLGVQFHTPEEFFLGNFSLKYEKEKFPFDPRTLGLSPTPLPEIKQYPLEVIVVVAAPGSGKSAITRQLFPNHVRVNNDTLKTRKKCLQLCQASLDNKKSVVIDNQNKCRKDREDYIKQAKAAGAVVRALRITVSSHQSRKQPVSVVGSTRPSMHQSANRTVVQQHHSVHQPVAACLTNYKLTKYCLA